MDWKDAEKAELSSFYGRGASFMLIATRTAELLAARGGTMTAPQMEAFRAQLEQDDTSRVADDWREDILAHIAAQGARVAVLEAENERLRKSADELQRQRDSSNESLEHMRERLTAAEEGNRELVRRAQQAEGERDQWQREHGSAMRRWKAEKDNAETWRKRVEAAADELADIGAGECGRLDIVTRVRMLKARCAALSAAGQVPSAHVDTTGAPEEEVSGLCERSYGPSEICGNCDPRDMPEREPHAFKPGHGTRDACRYASVVNGQLCGWERSAHRYPCSATCTHDDAATPGHADRVKERSEAVAKEVGGIIVTRREPTEEEQGAYIAGFDDGERAGSEAMRAACLEAALAWAEANFGMRPVGLKAAIEGAAP